MACYVDFLCKDCGKIFEYDKISPLNDIPENLECPDCNSKNIMRKWKIGTFDIAEGKLGNSKSGYNNGIVNHPSSFGKYKGIKIKV